MIFKESSHQLPCIAACRSTNQLLERQASGMLEKVKRGQSFAEQVAHVISPLLSGKTPTLDDVSTQLNMAPWTLRRNLAAQGHTFQQVLNDTRGQLAKSYVCDTNISLGEIAYLVGFSSPVAFQHAFKRWQGQAPGFYRQQFANKLKNNN